MDNETYTGRDAFAEEGGEPLSPENPIPDGEPAQPEVLEPGLTGFEAEAAKYKDLYLRSLAEMENVRRRCQKEKEETCRYAAEKILKGMVPVLDNLHLALSYADLSDAKVRTLAEGIQMTLKSFLDLLKTEGFREVEAARGQAFDPNVHEAMGSEPDPQLADMTVSREAAKGYILGDRLLRPAKVLVVRNPV
jgi:molecular chaperone GrpE